MSPERAATLRALIDRLLPGDQDPSAWDAGAGEFLDRVLSTDLGGIRADVLAGTDHLDRAARAGRSVGFAQLSAAEQDALIDDLSAGRSGADWPDVSGAGFIGLLSRLVACGFYGDPAAGGNRDAASWRMVGYRQAPQRSLPEAAGPVISPGEVADRYDAVVVGAGAGGGVAAALLAEAGWRVLLVERGRWLSSDELRPDHLHNARSLLGYPAPTELPDEGYPRVVPGADGPVTVGPADLRWSGNASTVGGGSRVFGAQAWRLCEEDFRMAAVYGVPASSSLADWPIGYHDLAPWYDRVEWELGVAGDPAGNRFAGLRARGYPMPPLPGNAGGEVLRRGARRLRLGVSPVPMLINSVPRGGRGACVRCGECVGFACPVGAKSGTHNTMIPRALATGRCDLLTGAHAERITTTASGRVDGVALVGQGPAGPWRRPVRAGHVLLAAGAIETARLLLNSPSAREPHGLGNGRDLVGRHLQAHVYAGAVGVFDEVVQDSAGPGPVVATNDFRHHQPGVVGGGMLANDFVPTPVDAWHRLTSLGAIPPYGLAGKQAMRLLWSRTLMVAGPVHEVTMPSSRVRIDPEVRDRFGGPAARLCGDIHPEDRRTAAFLADQASAWLRASGARAVYRMDAEARPARPSAGQHQAGTCRMGADPQSSVVDPEGRVWGHDNLLVVDGSVHVTNGGINPVLTILALSYRTVSLLTRAHPGER
jgi:choline dehydrogenase-like flavoprotein